MSCQHLFRSGGRGCILPVSAPASHISILMECKITYSVFAAILFATRIYSNSVHCSPKWSGILVGQWQNNWSVTCMKSLKSIVWACGANPRALVRNVFFDGQEISEFINSLSSTQLVVSRPVVAKYFVANIVQVCNVRILGSASILREIVPHCLIDFSERCIIFYWHTKSFMLCRS